MFSDDSPGSDGGIGVCGWLLFGMSWLMVAITLPFSLCVLLKVGLTSDQYCAQCSPLSLVEGCRGLALIGREDQSVATPALSDAIKNQLKASKANLPGHFLPFAVSLWQKAGVHGKEESIIGQ